MTRTAKMDSIRETPISKRSGNVAKRLIISMTPPPALVRLERSKRQFDGNGEEELNLPKKLRESPVTPVPALNLAKKLHTSPITPVPALNLPKKLFTSPITPVTPAETETTKKLPSLSLMAVSPEPTSKADSYNFDEPVVCTPDDNFFRPYTQKPIVINSNSPISPILVGSLYGKVKNGPKRVHFNKRNLKSIKAEVEKPNSSDLQLMGESYIHIFFHFAHANLE